MHTVHTFEQKHFAVATYATREAAQEAFDRAVRLGEATVVVLYVEGAFSNAYTPA